MTGESIKIKTYAALPKTRCSRRGRVVCVCVCVCLRQRRREFVC